MGMTSMDVEMEREREREEEESIGTGGMRGDREGVVRSLGCFLLHCPRSVSFRFLIVLTYFSSLSLSLFSIPIQVYLMYLSHSHRSCLLPPDDEKERGIRAD